MSTARIQLSDIARRAGLSTSGVSLALRNSPRVSAQKRREVQEVAAEMGYSLVPRRRHGALSVLRVGFLYVEPLASDTSSLGPIEPVIRVLISEATPLGMRTESQLTTGDVGDFETRRRLLDFLSDMDGVLVMGVVHEPLLELIHGLGLPVVVLGETDVSVERANEMRLQRVDNDPVESGRLATKYLLSRGCKRLGFMGGFRQTGFYYDQWHSGFLLAHAQAGRMPDPGLTLFLEFGKVYTDMLGPILAPGTGADGLVWPDQSMVPSVLGALKARGLKVADAEQVVGGMVGHGAKLGTEHFAQVLCDLSALGRYALKHLHAICRNRVDSAATILLPAVTRNLV